MRILYLCNKNYWDKKLARERFHAIEAIGKASGIEVFKSGIGFEGFKNAQQSEQEIEPDVIIWYKPLLIPGFDRVKVPTCLTYNEMYDIPLTTAEIEQSGTKFVVCHHMNDFINYSHIKGALLTHIPLCVSQEVFKDYGLEKKYDVLLAGSLGPVYPLRRRFIPLLPRLEQEGFRCLLLNHPGYEIKNPEDQIRSFARILNESKIVLTCSSKFRYPLGKYSEVALCNSVACGDIPDQDQEWYRRWVLEVSLEMTDAAMLGKIKECLMDNQKLLALSQVGREENLKYRTQEYYAENVLSFLRRNI